MRDAVISVFQAARFDFGSEFLKDMPTEREQNAWKHRLRHVVEGCRPCDLVDGYERAKSERTPFAPKLAHIAEAAKAEALKAKRVNDQLEHVNAPRLPAGSGLAGYIEYLEAEAEGDVAKGCIAMMREVLAKPDPLTHEEQQARLTKAVEAHDKLLAMVPIRPRVYGERRECGKTGCNRPGTISHDTRGEGPWFCREHCR